MTNVSFTEEHKIRQPGNVGPSGFGHFPKQRALKYMTNTASVTVGDSWRRIPRKVTDQ